MFGDTDVTAASQFEIVNETLGCSRIHDTRTASHGGYFVLIAFRVICLPLFALVESSVQIEEIREEAAGRHFAGKLVKVIVPVFRQIAHTTFLFPYLNREYGCFAVTYTLIGAFQKFANDAASFGGCIRAVIDRTEYYLDFVSKTPDAIGIIGVNWLSDRNDSTGLSFSKEVRVMSVSAADKATPIRIPCRNLVNPGGTS